MAETVLSFVRMLCLNVLNSVTIYQNVGSTVLPSARMFGRKGLNTVTICLNDRQEWHV